MKRFSVPLLCILTLLALHSVVRHHVASVFLAPVSIPILIATAIPLPAILIGLILIFMELLSSLPQGSMLLIFFIPFFTRYLMPWAIPSASWKFLSYICITVTIQILTLILILLISTNMSIYAIPFFIALMQIIGTSVSAFVLALLCYELRNN